MTQLRANGLTLADHKRNVFQCVPEAFTPFETLLTEGYWAHNSRMLSFGDRIEVFPPERSYFAELMVLDAGKLYAKVLKLRHVPLQKASPELADLKEGEFEAKWAGLEMQWCIVRGHDTVRTKLSKDDAIAYLKGLKKAA